MTLSLLYGDCQKPVNGMTRFEKLVFLTQEEILKEKHETMTSGDFEFEPDRFGPLSTELYDQLAYLESSSIIKKDQNNSYVLTARGREFVERIVLPRVPNSIVKSIEQLKQKWGNAELTSLLKYVYRQFPSCAVKSEIRDRIMR